MRIARSTKAVRIDGKCVIAETNACPIVLTFMRRGILRIRAGFSGDFAEKSYSLIRTAWESVTDAALSGERIRVEALQPEAWEEDDAFFARGGGLTVRIAKDPFIMTVLDESGAVLMETLPELGFREDLNGRRIHTFALGWKEKIYGLGEAAGGLNRAGAFYRQDGGDACGYAAGPVPGFAGQGSDPLYKQIPFFIRLSAEGRACGFFYDTPGPCAFDLGSRRSSYWKSFASFAADFGDIDLFLTAGPSIREALEGYIWLTGTSCLLPAQALGYLGSSMYYTELPAGADAAVLDFTDTAKENGMELSGFMLSSGYCAVETENGIKRCSFTWNPDRFPDPEAFFAGMREKGALVCCNVKPGVLDESPRRQEWEEGDALVMDPSGEKPCEGTFWGGKAAFVDYTSERGRKLWQEMARRHLLNYGCGAIWNDNCEFDSLTDLDARVCLEGAGGTIQETKPVMANLMCMASNAAMRQAHPGERPFSVCRAGYAGIQRYAQVWTGDNATSWESLRWNLPMMLNLSLSGVANVGSDVGGFFGPAPEEELLVRWIQHGIFMPRFSVHSSNDDNTVTEPWMYRGSVDTVRAAFALRKKLMPLFYSLMVRAAATGLPIMEPLIFAFQEDRACREIDDEFLLGDGLLVANVLEKGAKERQVYFPAWADGFYDYADGSFIRGGQTVSVPVDMESIPMYLRGGSVLPLREKDGLWLLAAAGASGEISLYDEADTGDAMPEAYETVSMCRREKDVVLSVDSRPGAEPLRLLVFAGERCPEEVFLETESGREILPRQSGEKALARAGKGWYYDHSRRCAVVLAGSVFSGEAVLRYSVKDLIVM